MKSVISMIAACALMVACSSELADEPVATNPVDDIDWFDGTVEEAFAAANATDKPIYLYWGAAWCPPCHAISATVFSKPEFLNRSRLFIPVYLDGDTENAQEYGEKFDVIGYPTMIVFDSSGEELTRIPNGIDIQAYANILDLTLNASSSASSLVARLMAGESELSANNCTLLAYHSWDQDADILENLDAAIAFRRMYEACPSDLRAEAAILFLSWFDAVLNTAETEETDAALDESRRLEARQLIEQVLADPVLAKANIFRVLFSGPRYVEALTEPDGEDRASLIRSFHVALDAIANDEGVYKRERIYTLTGKIGFERIGDEEAELSDVLKQEIRAITRWADESTPNVYERLPIVNALANVLEVAGMDDVAKPLLLAELERSKHPYYFMVGLANIEQRAGNNEAAIAWLRRAHEATRGPATRFQWGYYYIQGLLEMSPSDTQEIHDATVSLIGEMLQSGGFYQRPKAQLERLEGYLVEWGGDHKSALDDIRESVLAACASAAARDEACESFLEIA